MQLLIVAIVEFLLNFWACPSRLRAAAAVANAESDMAE